MYHISQTKQIEKTPLGVSSFQRVYEWTISSGGLKIPSRIKRVNPDAFVRPCWVSIRVIRNWKRACGSGFVPVREIHPYDRQPSSFYGPSAKGTEFCPVPRTILMFITARWPDWIDARSGVAWMSWWMRGSYGLRSRVSVGSLNKRNRASGNICCSWAWVS